MGQRRLNIRKHAGVSMVTIDEGEVEWLPGNLACGSQRVWRGLVYESRPMLDHCPGVRGYLGFRVHADHSARAETIESSAHYHRRAAEQCSDLKHASGPYADNQGVQHESFTRRHPHRRVLKGVETLAAQ